ncbi:thioredoxin family protein [Kitasatospora sp. NPDC047058]|uniref:thioredoxin family protein n=1 Tax=Kitasatospora sp. NPDC047058 TaxID=3155620 RepID=UPI0033DE9C08
MAVRAVTSTAGFDELVSSSKKVVVMFTTSWSGPSKVVAPKCEQLAADTPDVEFVTADTDELSEVSAAARVRTLPTFNTDPNGAKIAEAHGPDLARLKAAVAELSAVTG